MNLVSNAKNAMPFGGKLSITTAAVTLGQQGMGGGQLSPYAALIINDTGVGMSEAVRQRAFDPFFTTRASAGGTGLGLTSVQRFVGQSQGLIMLDSEAGRGTTVVIHLPRVDAPG